MWRKTLLSTVTLSAGLLPTLDGAARADVQISVVVPPVTVTVGGPPPPPPVVYQPPPPPPPPVVYQPAPVYQQPPVDYQEPPAVVYQTPPPAYRPPPPSPYIQAGWVGVPPGRVERVEGRSGRWDRRDRDHDCDHRRWDRRHHRR